MEVLAGRSLSTCCTCLRIVDTDGRIQCAECLDNSIMRACARRSGRAVRTAMASSSSCTAPSSSSSQNDFSRTYNRSHNSSSSSLSSSSIAAQDASRENPFASAVRYLPFPGRPRVVMIKNRLRSEEQNGVHQDEYGSTEREVMADGPLQKNGGGGTRSVPKRVSSSSSSSICYGSTSAATATDNLLVKVKKALEDRPSISTNTRRVDHVGATVKHVERQLDWIKPAAKIQALVQSLSLDRASVLEIKETATAIARCDLAGRKRCGHGGDISSSSSVDRDDAAFINGLVSSYSAPCSPGNENGSKQGSTSPLWERRCVARPPMLDIASVAVSV